MLARPQSGVVVVVDAEQAAMAPNASVRELGVAVLGVVYADRATITVAGRDRDELQGLVASSTSGAAEVESAGTDWIDA